MSQKKLNEALLEKEQVSSDLNTMERSFSDLFKRLEKYKDVIEGYKKVKTNLLLIFTLYKSCGSSIKIIFCAVSQERRDPESLCSGLSGEDQKGGAALPDP